MTTEDKALVLLNEVSLYKCENVDTAPHKDLCTALRRAIEQHEAFRQEVSDAVEKQARDVHEIRCLCSRTHKVSFNTLSQFIIPAPKPDPLVEALHEVDTGPEWDSAEDYCNKVRAALDKLGFEIRKKGK